MKQTKNDDGQAALQLDHSVWAQPKQSVRLNEAGEQWLHNRRAIVKDSTYVKYEAVWRCHIQPALGCLRAASIDTPLADAFMLRLRQEGLSAKTVRDVLMVLRSILAYAARNGEALPKLDVRCPKEPCRQMRVLSREEQDRLVRYLRRDMDCCRFGVLLALLTGIRLGELCALRWENISRSDRTISVGATMQRLKDLDGGGNGKTRVVISSPKSAAAVRVIPMSDRIAALCAEMGEHAPTHFVLTGTDKYMEPRVLQFRMKRYTEACGLAGVHFHTLRHTFATRSVEVGFDLKSLSEILGHANTSITLNRYVHISMEVKRDNMNKLTQAGL